MLCQASCNDLRKGTVSRKHGYIVIAMRKYPRGISRHKKDEYIKDLSPDPTLLSDFLKYRNRLADHNKAFGSVRYENRFKLSESGKEQLKRLAELSLQKDVYLICQCKEDQRCHRELLLIAAKRWFGASIAPLRFKYRVFEKRLLSPKAQTNK